MWRTSRDDTSERFTQTQAQEPFLLGTSMSVVTFMWDKWPWRICMVKTLPCLHKLLQPLFITTLDDSKCIPCPPPHKHLQTSSLVYMNLKHPARSQPSGVCPSCTVHSHWRISSHIWTADLLEVPLRTWDKGFLFHRHPYFNLFWQASQVWT